MRKTAVTFACIVFILSLAYLKRNNSGVNEPVSQETAEQQITLREISDNIRDGETFFDIFRRYGLSIEELFSMREASAGIYKLRKLSPGQMYKITVDEGNRVNSFSYWIDDDNILRIIRGEDGFQAEKKVIQYTKRIEHIGGSIRDNLIDSVGEGRENLMLALRLSDIFAWDLDFTSDLRNGDTFKMVVEGLYLNGHFRKFGEILSAEFINNGEAFYAYRFESDGTADYYDAQGRSLRRAFLKVPLSFRRISSYYSRGRLHPVLKIYRPHHGLDYAAPSGTPVSAVGDGRVVFTGRKGQYGNLVTIKHPNGWETRYGHLSRIGKNVKRGNRVSQGQVIGYVGASGLATGPHLHYEVRIQGRPVNPLRLDIPKGGPVPESEMTEFLLVKNRMNVLLASIKIPQYATNKIQKGKWKG